MKMHDLGEKWGKTLEAPAKEEKNKKHYPHEFFTVEQMPELAGRKIGDKVKVVYIAEVVGVTKRQNNKGEDKEEYTLEFREGGCEYADDEVGGLDKKKKIADMFKGEKKEEDDKENY